MTIALIFMVLFDMLVTKSTGGHSLTQVIKEESEMKIKILMNLENNCT
jgi:hypothetical protein